MKPVQLCLQTLSDIPGAAAPEHIFLPCDAGMQKLILVLLGLGVRRAKKLGDVPLTVGLDEDGSHIQTGLLTLARSGDFTVTTEYTPWRVRTRPLDTARFLEIANADTSDPVIYHGDAEFLKTAPQIVARRRAQIRDRYVRNSDMDSLDFPMGVSR